MKNKIVAVNKFYGLRFCLAGKSGLITNTEKKGLLKQPSAYNQKLSTAETAT